MHKQKLSSAVLGKSKEKNPISLGGRMKSWDNLHAYRK